MADQADTLRRLMQQRGGSMGRNESRQPCPPVITVASGKGGVGKTCLVANLGAVLARSGLRVLLVDGDSGLANLDIVLGVHAQATLEQLLSGCATMREVIAGVEPNLWLLPASSGFMDLKQNDPVSNARLTQVLESCPWEMDLVLIDAGAGIQDNVLSLHSPGYESVVVLTPEPTSLADGYGLIKLLRNRKGLGRVDVIVNQVTDGREAIQIYQKLKEVASRFIDIKIDYLGHWQRDEKITQSVMKRKILLDLDPGALSIPSLELLAKRLKSERLGWQEGNGVGTQLLMPNRFKEEPARMAPGNIAGFWRTLLGEVKA